jgi:hypothetical protein
MLGDEKGPEGPKPWRSNQLLEELDRTIARGNWDGKVTTSVSVVLEVEV